MTAVFEKTSTGFSAYVEEIPGLGVSGSTIDETEKLLREAIAIHFTGNPRAIPLTFKTFGKNPAICAVGNSPIWPVTTADEKEG